MSCLEGKTGFKDFRCIHKMPHYLLIYYKIFFRHIYKCLNISIISIYLLKLSISSYFPNAQFKFIPTYVSIYLICIYLFYIYLSYIYLSYIIYLSIYISRLYIKKIFLYIYLAIYIFIYLIIYLSIYISLSIICCFKSILIR